VTYVVAAGPDGRHGPAWYAACAASCEAPINWLRTRLADAVVEARLELDPDGHPRVLLEVDSAAAATSGQQTIAYRYATCDVGCGSEGGWDITTVATALADASAPADATNSYFALDPDGHPAFIYRDSPTRADHDGTYYRSCLVPDPADCGAAEAWSEVTLATRFPLLHPDLAFTAAGEPRFLGEYVDAAQGIDRLVYGECDAHCTVGGSTQLYGASPATSYSLKLDHDGRPRIVYYTGDSVGGVALDAHQLYYLWCDTSCTSPASWHDEEVPVRPADGQGVSLALDSHDRPRFVYKQAYSGPGLGWCDSDCESVHATWRSGLVEGTAALQEADPLAATIDCSVSDWTSGGRPSLALDPHDRAVIGFDTSHHYGGTDLRLGHSGEACPVATDLSMARVAMLPEPVVAP